MIMKRIKHGLLVFTVTLFAAGFFMVMPAADQAFADSDSAEGVLEAAENTAAYGPVLDEYTDFLQRLDAKEVIDPYELTKYGYQYITESVAICSMDENYTGSAKTRPEFAFIDIDYNGILELVIGAREKYAYPGSMNGYAIGSIFTLDSNMKPRALIESYSFRYREYITIYTDGVIEDGGNGGAETNGYSFYTINGKAALTLQDELVQDWGTFTHNGQAITEGEFYELKSQLQNREKVSIAWNKFKVKTAYDKKLAKATLSGIRPAKKSMTIKWKKLSKKQRKTCSKIEIQYSLKKSFPWKQTFTKAAKKTSKSIKIKKLKAKKTYYVRIRTIKTVNGVKHVSKWTKVKKVKTK